MIYLIYDGACGFCNKTVMFVAKNDKNNHFKFVSNLSDKGKNLLLEYNIEGLEASTIIIIENDVISIKSKAVIKILKKLPRYKFAGIIMSVFPSCLSDFVYDIISKHRKKIIKNSRCEIPEPEIRKKFID